MIATLFSLLVFQQNFVAHEFVYTNSTAKTVHVAGTFNSWNKESHSMVKESNKPVWRLTKKLPIGRHQYKFVIDGQNWVPDPNGDNKDDGYGNINTFLNLVPEDFNAPAILGDGKVTLSVARHNPDSGDVTYNAATQTVRLLARSRKGDVLEAFAIIEGRTMRMQKVASDDLTDIFSCSVKVSNPNQCSYAIYLNDEQSENSQKSKTTTLAEHSEFDFTTYAEAEVPAWTQSAIFYQIFPDRFENGSNANDPDNVVPWGSQPTYSNFMGGDLNGIQKRIDYLADLGITGIYFNPIFSGPSNHGYETTDFKKIEPRLGTNDEFSTLTRNLKNRGISVILDGVFNHTSVDFLPFKEIRDKGKDAKSLNWYTVKSFPVEVRDNPPYEAWAGYKSMPKLNVLNPEVKEYLFSVLNFWNSQADIAGWRLDVANEVPQSFWREFRLHLKALNSDSWIIGENWSNSSEWLKGDQWDSAMNYPMRGAILNHIALGSTTSSQFINEMMSAYLMYGPTVSNNMLNSISTHDVPRFKHFAQEDDKLNAMGAIALFAVPGVPCIYYGDELGMTGGVDPDNRGSMEWSRASDTNTTLALYKRLISARKSCRALQVGEPIPLLTDDTKQISAFARVAGTDSAIACFNRSNRAQTIELNLSEIPQGSTQSLVDVVSGKELILSGGARLRLNLPAKSAVLAVARVCIEPTRVQENLTLKVIQR